jgi:signal recognition particle subunit SRP54
LEWALFEGLSGKLGAVFDRLRGRGSLSEADVTEALREYLRRRR